LDQHVENLALVIDSTPEIQPLARDAHHHLVQMPAIARPRAALAQPSRDRQAELQHPAPHGFVGDVEPAFGQQFLDIAIAQGEAEIEPDRMLDDLGREAMAAIAERSRADILSDPPVVPDLVGHIAYKLVREERYVVNFFQKGTRFAAGADLPHPGSWLGWATPVGFLPLPDWEDAETPIQ